MEKKNESPKIQQARIVYPDTSEANTLLYSNAVQINHSPWDFALHFAQLVVPTNPSKGQSVEIKARPVAVINIPVTLVRGLIKALQTNIETYEKNYGKVDIPREAKRNGGNGPA